MMVERSTQEKQWDGGVELKCSAMFKGHFFTTFGQPYYRKLTLYEMNANLQISR